jgi:ABC transport system ATP-binding/permease protein
VKIGYYDQLGRDLDLTARVRDAVAGDKGEPSIEDVKLMRRFWFDGDAQFAPIGTLSGGERRRLQLLLTLLEQPNVLLLDEPTNDLDLDTLRALEDFLDDWPGIVVIVSHDRAFLDRTVSEVLAIDGTGRVELVAGGVAGWLAQRAAKGAAPAAAPPAPTRPAAPSAPTRPASTKSPSTLRHQLGLAERKLDEAIAKRDTAHDALVAASDHTDLARLGGLLAAAQERVDAAEAHWLTLADEAESIGMEM